MPTDAEVLESVRQAFASCRRPDHFTNHAHCEECAEYDRLFRSRDRDSLELKDVAQPGGALCFLTPIGFLYYAPALVRLGLEKFDAQHGWFGGALMFHLIADGPRNTWWKACRPEQRRAIGEFVDHLMLTRGDWEGGLFGDDLLHASEIWSDDGHG